MVYPCPPIGNTRESDGTQGDGGADASVLFSIRLSFGDCPIYIHSSEESEQKGIMQLRRLFAVCLLAAIGLSAVGLPGCGRKSGTVKGKVTFNGAPLNQGSVAFVNKDRIRSGTIKSDGTYEVVDVPLGEATITVQTPPPTMGFAKAPQAPSGVPAMPKDMMPPDAQGNSQLPAVSAPPKYNKVETSDLKYTVQSGTQEYNIVLKP